MQGFIVFNLYAKYEKEFYDVFPKLVASGELKYKEHVFEGLEKMPEALIAVQKGDNTGKAVVKVL